MLRYHQCFSLILAVITRWGTQYRLVHSLLRSKDALRAYAYDLERRPQDLRGNALSFIKDTSFWGDLGLLNDVLEPIDNVLRQSESDHAHLGTVIPRWISIESLLKQYTPQLPELESFCNLHFYQRFTQQSLNLHWAAHFLMPTNAKETLTPKTQRRVFHFFQEMGKNSSASIMRAEFLSFRNKTSCFSANADCWEDVENPLLFWQIQATFAPVLGRIAVRLFGTPANSVPCERAFSAQNLIHTQKRNRLQPGVVNKLVFILINQRHLDAIRNKEKSVFWQDNDEELALENELAADPGVVLDELADLNAPYSEDTARSSFSLPSSLPLEREIFSDSELLLE